jgi:hypothetical protein
MASEFNSPTHFSLINENSADRGELLKYMLSTSSWVDGKLEVELFEAFDLLLNLA